VRQDDLRLGEPRHVAERSLEVALGEDLFAGLYHGGDFSFARGERDARSQLNRRLDSI
jgi:hypothetical protein